MPRPPTRSTANGSKDTITNDPAFGATAEARQELLFRGGLRIVTPLDPAVQAACSAGGQRRFGAHQPGGGGCCGGSAGHRAGPRAGEQSPWGRDAALGQSEVPYPVVAKFQPGSTFKPITLAAAVEQGFDLDTVWDAPPAYTPAELNAPREGSPTPGMGRAGPCRRGKPPGDR